MRIILIILLSVSMAYAENATIAVESGLCIPLSRFEYDGRTHPYNDSKIYSMRVDKYITANIIIPVRLSNVNMRSAVDQEFEITTLAVGGAYLFPVYKSYLRAGAGVAFEFTTTSFKTPDGRDFADNGYDTGLYAELGFEHYFEYIGVGMVGRYHDNDINNFSVSAWLGFRF